MRLNNLIADIDVELGNNFLNPLVSQITHDSREAAEGAVFFAIAGEHTDGHQFVDQALDAGAVAVVHDHAISHCRPNVCYIKVKNVRAALSLMSARFFGNPSREMFIIGVTGTDGKSTTVSFIQQLLQFSGSIAGSISTVEFNLGSAANAHMAGDTQPDTRKSASDKTIEQANAIRQSTPDPHQINQLLRQMLQSKATHAVIEATSHGLSKRTRRLADIDFNAAVLTNVSSEHLDFHGSIENYRRDKAILFQMIAQSRHLESFSVINMDDSNASLFMEATGDKPVITYSLNSPRAHYYTSHLKSSPSGCHFMLHTPAGSIESSINIPGIYNVENALAAISTVANACRVNPRHLAEWLPRLNGVKGRMEAIRGNMNFHVIIDYAHTPASFSKVLPFLKTLTEKRLILVFGSAGERDVEKRPLQGCLAQQYGDLIILCNEDPRNENPMTILKDIAAGMRQSKSNFQLIPDRREAIAQAFKLAEPGDLIATLGKGHENSIITEDGSQRWDEKQICQEELERMGFEIHPDCPGRFKT